MNNYVLAEYLRLRRLGWGAQFALSQARVHDAFTDAMNAGLAKLDLESDCEAPEEPDWERCYRSVQAAERAQKAYRQRLAHEGAWYLVVYARPNKDAPWSHVDSIGGFVGDDWRDSGYDYDLERAALEALDAFNAQSARELESRATYAGVSP